MYAPRVFVSMICALLFFAGAAYWMTGSVYTAVLQTILCAIILQVGYFIGVLYLVRREKILRHQNSPDSISSQRTSEARSVDTIPAEAATQLHITDR